MIGCAEIRPRQAMSGALAAIEAEVRRTLHDPAVSSWLRGALSAALDRDPLDAADDAERLRDLLELRLSAMLPGAGKPLVRT